MCRILTLPKLLYDWMLSECMMMYMYESFICLTWHVSIGIICLYCYLYSSKGTVLSTYFKKFTLHIDFTLHRFICVFHLKNHHPIPTKTCRQIFLWGVPLCYMSYCCFYQLFSITVHCILCNNQFVKFIFSYFGSISWLNPTTSSTLTRVTCIWPL